MLRSDKKIDLNDPIEHLIFSKRPVEDYEILDLEETITFRRKYVNAIIKKEEYFCELKTVRNFTLDLTEPVQAEK
jgi:hypothetical protein